MLNDEMFTPQNLEEDVERDRAGTLAVPVRQERLWSHLDLTSAEPVVELDGSILAAAYRAFTERAPDSNGHHPVASSNGHRAIAKAELRHVVSEDQNGHRPLLEPNARISLPASTVDTGGSGPNDPEAAVELDGQLSWPTSTEFQLDLWPGELFDRPERSSRPPHDEIWQGEEPEPRQVRPAQSGKVLRPFRRYRRYRHYRKYPWRKTES